MDVYGADASIRMSTLLCGLRLVRLPVRKILIPVQRQVLRLQQIINRIDVINLPKWNYIKWYLMCQAIRNLSHIAPLCLAPFHLVLIKLPNELIMLFSVKLHDAVRAVYVYQEVKSKFAVF